MKAWIARAGAVLGLLLSTAIVIALLVWLGDGTGFFNSPTAKLVLSPIATIFGVVVAAVGLYYGYLRDRKQDWKIRASMRLLRLYPSGVPVSLDPSKLRPSKRQGISSFNSPAITSGLDIKLGKLAFGHL